jgi:hypothetical protein
MDNHFSAPSQSSKAEPRARKRQAKVSGDEYEPPIASDSETPSGRKRLLDGYKKKGTEEACEERDNLSYKAGYLPILGRCTSHKPAAMSPAAIPNLKAMGDHDLATFVEECQLEIQTRKADDDRKRKADKPSSVWRETYIQESYYSKFKIRRDA